jgi:phosphoribosylanthranilate isomerase
MIVKICGITNQQDADAAVAGGATAVGFNFYPRSPRYIEPSAAGRIETPAGIRRAGVFVNERPEAMQRIAAEARLDAAQLHGDESPADYPAAIAVWKAARVTAGFDLAGLACGDVEAVLLDGPAAELYGGAGKTFDWMLAQASRHRIIVAGGLDAGNVAIAVALARPWGVDACSRIESAPGKKDHRKMNEFLQAARAALGA